VVALSKYLVRIQLELPVVMHKLGFLPVKKRADKSPDEQCPSEYNKAVVAAETGCKSTAWFNVRLTTTTKIVA
jgi:Fic family protein